MAEVICPRCKTPNRDTARFCAECGELLVIQLAGDSRPPVRQARKNASTPTPDMILEGRYRIESELGRGGFGAVFKALDLRLNKPVAVKENMDSSPEAQRQFGREATVLANLAHPNLPRVIDHFSIPDLGQYLVMDFVAGEDLNTMIAREGALPLEAAVSWIAQVADALDYLHNQEPPVFHRDVKPANIRITRSSGPYGRAMLVDFGLVKSSDPTVKTTMGARAITPGYAPPEQYGVGYTDARTDIYALGATLYASVTGHEPVESVQRMTGKVVLPAHTVNPAVPASLSRAIERSMALEPPQRYQTAADFRAALQACLVDVRSMQSAAYSGPRPPLAGTEKVDSTPRPASGPRPEPVSRPESDRRPVVQPQYGGGPAPATAVMGAGVDESVRPASQPVPSRPVSPPVSSGGKKAISVAAVAAVVLCLVLAIGGYALFSFSQQSGARGSTQTVLAQATAMAQLAGTSTGQAALVGQPIPGAGGGAAETATQPATTPTTSVDTAATERVQATRAHATALSETRTMVARTTMQAIEEFLPAEALGKLSFASGPQYGSIAHEQDQYIEEVEVPGSYKNFLLQVTFFNPYSITRGKWDYGVLFRSYGANDEYRLIIRSDKSWKLGDGKNTDLITGTLKNLDTSENGQNTIVLVCLEERGWFYLNGELVREMKLTARKESGGLSIGTGMYSDGEIKGEATKFDNLNVWTIIWP